MSNLAINLIPLSMISYFRQEIAVERRDDDSKTRIHSQDSLSSNLSSEEEENTETRVKDGDYY
jgi:hypothetical protein